MRAIKKKKVYRKKIFKKERKKEYISLIGITN